jgi:hypothetical protein
MEKKNKPYLKLSSLTCLCIFALALSGCTNAKIQVNYKSSSLPIVLTSASPYILENYGDSFRFKGTCSRNAKTIQFQLDDYGWLDISKKPSLNTANFEYLTFPDVYDVDCGDGNFDFYLLYRQFFESYAAIGVSLPGGALGGYIPQKMKFRVMDNSNKELGIAAFESPAVQAISVRDYNNPSFTAKLNDSKKYRIELTNDKGLRANAAKDYSFTIRVKDNNNRFLQVFQSDCVTNFETAFRNKVTLSKYNSDLEVCIKYSTGTMTTDNMNTALVTVGTNYDVEIVDDSGQLPTTTQKVSLKMSSDVYTRIQVGNIRMVKGVEYPIWIQYRDYGSNSSISDFYYTQIQLPSGVTSSDISIANGINNPFDSFSTSNSISYFNFSATAQHRGSLSVRVNSNTSIFQLKASKYAGSASHDAAVSIPIPVDLSGEAIYSKPVLISERTLYDNSLLIGQRVNQCESYGVAMANVNGTPLPPTTGTEINLSSLNGGTFYLSNSSCSSMTSPINSITFSLADESNLKEIYYRAPATIPMPQGFDQITLSDSANSSKSSVQKVYLKIN